MNENRNDLIQLFKMLYIAKKISPARMRSNSNLNDTVFRIRRSIKDIYREQSKNTWLLTSDDLKGYILSDSCSNIIRRINGEIIRISEYIGASVKDAIKYKSNTWLRSKRAYFKIGDLYYEKNYYFLFDGKAYRKEEFFIEDGKIVDKRMSVKLFNHQSVDVNFKCEDERTSYLDLIRNTYNTDYLVLCASDSNLLTKDAMAYCFKYKGKRLCNKETQRRSYVEGKGFWDMLVAIPLDEVPNIEVDFGVLQAKLDENKKARAEINRSWQHNMMDMTSYVISKHSNKKVSVIKKFLNSSYLTSGSIRPAIDFVKRIMEA